MTDDEKFERFMSIMKNIHEKIKEGKDRVYSQDEKELRERAIKLANSESFIIITNEETVAIQFSQSERYAGAMCLLMDIFKKTKPTLFKRLKLLAPLIYFK